MTPKQIKNEEKRARQREAAEQNKINKNILLKQRLYEIKVLKIEAEKSFNARLYVNLVKEENNIKEQLGE